MAAAVVYDGVKGKYEGTLFNGLRFWVALRVPTRSSIVDQIKDNGGKIVLLEKLADILIADHARKDVPANSVSWKYVTDSVANGALVNVEDYRIHHANVPRPVGSARPARATKVPYTALDERILVTWVRQQERVGKAIRGNAIYETLAEMYPQHSWQSWKDKWVNKLSLLPENQLPAVLKELPPAQTQPTTAPEVKPVVTAVPRASPAATNPAVPSTSVRERVPRARLRFTEEDDKLLTRYVKERVRAGEKDRGNKIYVDFEEEYPHHTFQAWRDRWVRHLSLRSPEASPNGIESGVEDVKPKLEPAAVEPSSASGPQPKAQPARAPPPNPPRTQTVPVRAPPARASPPARAPRPAKPAPSQARPARPPPPATAPAPTPERPAPGQPMSRFQELVLKGKRTRAARRIQSVWRGYRLRRDLGRASDSMAHLQPRAQGFLVRRSLGFDLAGNVRVGEVNDRVDIKRELEEDAWFTAVEQVPGPAREDPLLPPVDEEEEAMVSQEEEAMVSQEEEAMVSQEEEAMVSQDEGDELGLEDEESLGGHEGEDDDEGALRQEEDVSRGAHEGEDEGALEQDAELSPGDQEEAKESQPSGVAPAATSQRSNPIPPNELFWRDFNQYNELNDLMPGPWAQIGHRAVAFWDLWRCATAEPHHALRDWETVAECLGFDWIEEPRLPEQLQEAFEKHLLGFEEALKEFDQWDEDEEGEEEMGAEEMGTEELEEEELGEEKLGEEKLGEEEELDDDDERTGYEISQDADEGADEALVQDEDEETASEADADFVSSPPVVTLKRARPSSATSYFGSTSKRPRYDPDREIPYTPETRTERAGQGVAGSRAAAAIQQTPTRGPRFQKQAQDSQTSRFDGADEDEVLTPSQQLQSELDAVSPTQGPSRSVLVSSPNRPLPSVEQDDDEDEDSSDGFESPSKLPIRNLRNPRPAHDPPHRRVLPWSKGKQPITTTSTPRQPSTTTTPTTTTAPRPGSSTSNPPKPKPKPVPAPTPTPTLYDPTPLVTHFQPLHYPPHLLSRAIRATSCHISAKPLVQMVLDALVRKEGIPRNQRGVWTDKDDERMRRIGGFVDRLGGVVPPLPPAAAVAAARRGEGGMGWEEEVFWGLVAKHGRRGVLERRGFLKAWDEA